MTPTPQLLAEYARLWDTMSVFYSRKPDIDAIVVKAQHHRAEYEAAAAPHAMPWELLAAVHNMESGMDFTTHLHNGDSLSARTIHKPAGRPVAGHPPFTWAASAADALVDEDPERFKGLWTIPHALYWAEGYNGWGYRTLHPQYLSDYLWAGTHFDQPGKFIADGTWSSTAVGKQIGVAPVLWALGFKGETT